MGASGGCDPATSPFDLIRTAATATRVGTFSWLLSPSFCALSSRRRRAYAALCCRRLWRYLGPAGRAAVQAAESFLAGRIQTGDLYAAHRSAMYEAGQDRPLTLAVLMDPSGWDADVDPYDLCAAHAAAETIADGDLTWLSAVASHEFADGEQTWAIIDHFEDRIAGRVVPPAVAQWQHGRVCRIAAEIRHDGGWDCVGVLGDALADAGVEDQVILSHCRAGRGHYPGCWVVEQCVGLGAGMR